MLALAALGPALNVEAISLGKMVGEKVGILVASHRWLLFGGMFGVDSTASSWTLFLEIKHLEAFPSD